VVRSFAILCLVAVDRVAELSKNANKLSRALFPVARVGTRAG
jgi:hypothetical protein